MGGSKDPPNYDDVFPPKPSESTGILDSELGFLKKVDIVPVPVMREVLEVDSSTGSFVGPQTKKYLILDGETGSEVLHGKNIPSTNPDLRGLSLFLENGKEVLKSAYVYAKDFSTIEFSNVDGSPLGVFKKESMGLGLCGCCCLCFCCPVASAAIKSLTGEPLLLFDSQMFPRKIDVFQPKHIGGACLGNINVEKMNSEAIVQTTLTDAAGARDKVLIIGLAMTLMDYERIHHIRKINIAELGQPNFTI